MTKKPAVSIIVAVYNAEKYLSRCIDSILAQTFTDWECLLIDDGSPDNSGKMCDEYARQDSRFKVVHKSNGGVGSARKCGIDNASGEYTIHIDPDDWVEPDMLQELYSKAIADNADMVICDYFDENIGKKKYVSQRPRSLTNDGVIKGLMSYMHGSCWNKMIRLECYRITKLNFIEGLDFGEDKIMNLRLLQFPMRIAYCPKAFYHYITAENKVSATMDFSEGMVVNKIKYIEYLKEFLGLDRYEFYNAYVRLAFYSLKEGCFAKERYLKLFGHIRRIEWNRCLPIRKLIVVLLALNADYEIIKKFIKQFSI